MEVAKYIAIPYRSHGRDRRGLDCYGLCRLVLREEFGVELPSYDDEYADAAEVRETRDAILRHLSEWTPVARPRDGDVVVLRLPFHVGIYYQGQILNVREGVDCCLEDLDSGMIARRIHGIYRHASRA